MSLCKCRLQDGKFIFKFCGIGFKINCDRPWYARYAKAQMQKRLAPKAAAVRAKAKIKVGFLVAEAAKWCYHSVYEEFAASERFEPVVLVTRLASEHKGRKLHYQSSQECFDFFVNRGYNTAWAYDFAHRRYLSPAALDIDVLFYEQPWDVQPIQAPHNVSKYALTCYVPYGMELTNWAENYMETFHRWLDVIFRTVDDITVLPPAAVERDNIIFAGYPKLDEYAELTPCPPAKPVLIYAPHHSFDKNGIHFATFAWNGRQILELAQKYADKFTWIFKPHPRFRHALQSCGIMSAEQGDAYFAAWEKLGTVYESGDYFAMFANSAGMITDCCSFLGEYLPSRHPVLHLINEQALFTDMARQISDGYYQIRNSDELAATFERVFIRGDDYLKSDRLARIPLVYDEKEKVATKIRRIVEQKLGLPAVERGK